MKHAVTLMLVVLTSITPVKSRARAADEGAILAYLYPNADPQVDYLLKQDGEFGTPYLAEWDDGKLGIEPTIAFVQSKHSEWSTAQSTSATAETNLVQSIRTKLTANQALTDEEVTYLLQ